MNYIETHRPVLEVRHYILNPQGTETHWLNFRVNQMRLRTEEWGKEFCVVISLSRTSDNAYVVPYVEVESLFVPELVASTRDRWIGNLIDENLRIVSGDVADEVFVGGYYRRFDLLHGAPHPLPARTLVNYDF